jgi:hypothetical protein
MRRDYHCGVVLTLASFRPIVKIDCCSTDPPTALTTGLTFSTSDQALEFGQDMAREWIDGHFKGGADLPRGRQALYTLRRVSLASAMFQIDHPLL